MPRIIANGTSTPPARVQRLVSELSRELRENHESGQPVIREDHYPRTGMRRVTVVWDEWKDVPHEERVDVVRRAYQEVEGQEIADKLALILGLTYPEAYEAEMLPCEVVPLLRKGDPVTEEECLAAMRAEGASLLFPGGKPRLLFASRQEADAALGRLVEQLPRSKAVWTIMIPATLLESAM
ncbi:hypothetical protein [Paludisphaera rhizosphaerae]|uniref:hypothetical protein n=1 Tax=Paludisphaera rhizosphaerae TaxID=2711216 RepID=UPI0013ECC617|nr:hypothetical protein [Paludisphaera rhizosphaerae]